MELVKHLVSWNKNVSNELVVEMFLLTSKNAESNSIKKYGSSEVEIKTTKIMNYIQSNLVPTPFVKSVKFSTTNVIYIIIISRVLLKIIRVWLLKIK